MPLFELLSGAAPAAVAAAVKAFLPLALLPVLQQEALAQVARSLRFNAGDSANLTRTVTTSATFTFSAWVKRTAFGAVSPLLGSSIQFTASDTLTAFGLTTTAVFRDPSAWYHVHVSNSGLYVNGVSFGAVTTSALTNPAIGYNGTQYANHYLAEVCLVDGASVAVAAFGKTDATTGAWVPKQYSGGLGAKGFLLKFADNSNTTAATLGKDSSSNGNNWTPNNFSVAAGVGNDSFVDSPTSYGTDTGAGGEVRGNYCTIGTLDKHANVTVTNGGLDITISSGDSAAYGVVAITQKTYFEYTPTTVGGAHFMGVLRTDHTESDHVMNSGMDSTQAWALILATGNKDNGSGSAGTAYGTAASANDTIMVAIDPVNGKVWWGRNGTWFTNGGVGDPAAGTNAAFTNLPASVLPAVGYGSAGGIAGSFNFGQRPFAHTAPSGYKALCTQNAAEGTITTSGSFNGTAAADGPVVWLNGAPTAMTINGNAVTFGTHADRLASGFKLRTSSASYNASGNNTFVVSLVGLKFKYGQARVNP